MKRTILFLTFVFVLTLQSRAAAIVAHDPGYYTSLANHIARWLRSEGVTAVVTTPGAMKKVLQQERVAFLVGFVTPTAAEIAELKAFRQRGGKLIVFYSSSPQLADMMGVKTLGYKQASYPGEWSRMNFNAKTPEGLPPAILQTSTVLMRVTPLPGKGRVIATWADRIGKSTGEAAWIATPSGYWMSHVLLADGDEELKAQLCAALVSSVVPKSWSYAVHRAKASSKANALVEFAKKQTPRKGEIHAVWDHSGCGLYPGNWPKTMEILKRSKVTDVFVNVAGAGFAHYPSAILPRSKTYQQEGDQLAAALGAAQGMGIRVHAWVLCFSATRSTPDRLKEFQKRGWRLKTPQGKLTEYLDPANPAVREYVLRAVAEISTKYPVAGIHLDFVRWGDSAAKPKDAAVYVTRFVSEARRQVKRPKWLTAAVYGKYPNCVASVGQDWDSWMRLGLLDYVVPMDYSDSNEKFEELLKQQSLMKAHARKTIAGLGITANESRLDAKKAIEQINLTRRYGLAGNALFDLDTTLEKNILPYLRMGIW